MHGELFGNWKCPVIGVCTVYIYRNLYTTCTWIEVRSFEHINGSNPKPLNWKCAIFKKLLLQIINNRFVCQAIKFKLLKECMDLWHIKYSKYCGFQIVVGKFIQFNNFSSIWMNFITVFMEGSLLLWPLVNAMAHTIWSVWCTISSKKKVTIDI
jgi:hypothetical protein